MAQPLTGRQIRDQVRRQLGRLPACDLLIGPPDAEGRPTYGPSGEPAPNQQQPTNRRIDQALEAVLARINAECSIGGGDKPVSIDVAAQTADGPYRIDLSTAFSPRGEGQVIEINRVWWNDGSATTVLRSTHYRELDRDRRDWTVVPPGTPSQYWVDSYVLWILPAPAVAGQIRALTTFSLSAPATDDDVIAQVPADLFPVIVKGTALEVALDQPYDSVQSARVQTLTSQFERGLVLFRDLFNTMDSARTFRITPLTYRYRRSR